VKDIREMIGKMIWDTREEAAYLEVFVGEKRARLTKYVLGQYKRLLLWLSNGLKFKFQSSKKCLIQFWDVFSSHHEWFNFDPPPRSPRRPRASFRPKI
jgi:hypothetical protein